MLWASFSLGKLFRWCLHQPVRHHEEALELATVSLVVLPDGAQFGCCTNMATLLLAPMLITCGWCPTLLCRYVDLFAISMNIPNVILVGMFLVSLSSSPSIKRVFIFSLSPLPSVLWTAPVYIHKNQVSVWQQSHLQESYVATISIVLLLTAPYYFIVLPISCGKKHPSIQDLKNFCCTGWLHADLQLSSVRYLKLVIP